MLPRFNALNLAPSRLGRAVDLRGEEHIVYQDGNFFFLLHDR
jgi:hypothetical protein